MFIARGVIGLPSLLPSVVCFVLVLQVSFAACHPRCPSESKAPAWRGGDRETGELKDGWNTGG